MNFLIFGAENLNECISPAIEVMVTIRCSLYSAFVASYSAHHPVSAMLTVFLVKSNAFIMNFLIFGAENLNERISPAIEVMLTIRCSLYSAFVALYNAHHPVSAMLIVVPVRSNAFALQFPIFRAKILIERISPAIGVM
jgi:Flp pilus assembly protein protease CpaA